MPPNTYIYIHAIFIWDFFLYSCVLCYVSLQLQNGEKKRHQIKVSRFPADAAHTKQKPSCSKSMVFLWIQTTPCSPGTFLQHSLYIWFSIADYLTELLLSALRLHAQSHRELSYSSWCKHNHPCTARKTSHIFKKGKSIQ